MAAVRGQEHLTVPLRTRKPSAGLQQPPPQSMPPRSRAQLEQAQLGRLRIHAHTKDRAEAHIAVPRDPPLLAVRIILRDKRIHNLAHQHPETLVKPRLARLNIRMRSHNPITVIRGKGAYFNLAHAPTLTLHPLAFQAAWR